MTAHYYARECVHGLNVVWKNNDGSTNSLPGVFVRFPTREARDAWVDADPYPNGHATREGVTRAQIEPKLRQSARYAPRPGSGPTWDDPENTGIETLLF